MLCMNFADPKTSTKNAILGELTISKNPQSNNTNGKMKSHNKGKIS